MFNDIVISYQGEIPLKLKNSITVRMTIATAALLVAVLAVVNVWRDTGIVARWQAELQSKSALTANLVLRSFEAVDPDKFPVHEDYLARNLVELPDIHDILVVAANGRVAFSHHPEEIGKLFDPTTEQVCGGCHTAGGIHSESREYTSRNGQPVYHEGFPITNGSACRRCHDSRQEILGMLLMSLELTPFYAELTRRHISFVWLAVAVVLASLLSFWGLFRVLVRQPLARLESDIRSLEGGDFQHLHGPRGENEIAILHASFITMAGRLREARAELENRVREGTQRIDSLSGELDLVYSNLMHLEHLSAMGTVSVEIAHEIRTPLNAMALHLQLLGRSLRRGGGDDEEIGELFGDMNREVQRIVETLNQFMARVRRPMPKPDPEPLGPVVESAIFLMGAEARHAGVVIEKQIAPEVRLLPAHANHIRQILTNLVSNAVKVTPHGGRVRVRAFLDSERVRIFVEDSGPGVPQAMRQRIREPFFTTHPDGTGMGLAIVEHILQDCGGSLDVGDAQDLGGAAFMVTLRDCAPAAGCDTA
ncbi:MAG: HAMP domain-containing histidine kinase [Desulfuromonadales bacterium]|nr:HAMP domain-containing histidine kinase [Desulfuromonadales bacterium]